MSEFEDKFNAILGDRDAMGQIMALARSLGKREEEDPAPEEPTDTDGYVPVGGQEGASEVGRALPELGSILDGIDPKMMQIGMQVLREYNRSDDRNTALLNALRPFVREERFAKVDRAVQIARLSRVIRVLLDAVKGKGGGGVV